MAEVLLLAAIGLLVFCLLLTLLALLIFSGLFENVNVGTGKPPIGEVTLAYKFARGPYKDSGQLFTEISLLAPPGGHRCIGIYYDDPKSVPAHELRYAVGAILSEDGKPEDEEFKGKLLAEGYKMFTLPSVSFAVSTCFPYKSSLSIFVAVSRVYPALESYIQEHRLCAHPMLEIYEDNNIHFMAPLAKQSEFYVEEAEGQGVRLDEDEADPDEASIDESMLDSSISRSEASATTFMGEQSDVDEEEGTDNDGSSPRPSVLSVNTSEQAEHNPNPELLDSGFSSEQVTSPDISPQKTVDVGDKVGDVSDGNESGSSFEEIQMDSEPSTPSVGQAN